MLVSPALILASAVAASTGAGRAAWILFGAAR
jgi:hypothetical protein